MSAERIAVVEAPHFTTEPLRSTAVLSDGSFLDAVQIASAANTIAPPEAASPLHPARDKQETLQVFDAHDENHTWTPNNWVVEEESNFFGEDGFDITDLLDIINPLQHLPIISSIYRSLTGDEISPGARLAGGTIFGGPVGLASSFISALVEDVTETTIGDVVIAAFTKDDENKADAQLPIISPQAHSNAEDTVTAGAIAALMPQASAPVNMTKSKFSKPETRQAIQPEALMAAFEKPKPTPLAFARDLLESPKASLIPPSAQATKSVITAEEAMRAQPKMTDPVSAILAARSQVPNSGSISGLPSHRSSSKVIAGIETRALEQTAVPSIDMKRSVRPTLSYEAGKRGAPPPRGNSTTLVSGRRQAAAAASVPNTMVPKAMLSALDKYESMLLDRHRASDDDPAM